LSLTSYDTLNLTSLTNINLDGSEDNYDTGVSNTMARFHEISLKLQSIVDVIFKCNLKGF